MLVGKGGRDPPTRAAWNKPAQAAQLVQLNNGGSRLSRFKRWQDHWVNGGQAVGALVGTQFPRGCGFLATQPTDNAETQH